MDIGRVIHFNLATTTTTTTTVIMLHLCTFYLQRLLPYLPQTGCVNLSSSTHDQSRRRYSTVNSAVDMYRNISYQSDVVTAANNS